MPSKSRKPKSTGGQPVTSNKTVFVKNLPTDCEESELTKVFSQFGEVVKCFTVGKHKKHEKDKCVNSIKYAFVTFSTEDGVSAVLTRKLVKLRQQRLICLAAKRRVRQRIKSKQTKLSDKPKTENSDSDSDSDSVSESDSEDVEIESHDSRSLEEDKHLNVQSRSLVLSGLPLIPQSEGAGKYRDMIQRLADQFIPGLESVESVPQLEDKLLLTFSSKTISRKAMTLLNGLSWGDGQLHVQLASLALLETSVKHQKKSKLLVRNLSFKSSVEELRKSFERFGHVVEAHIPQKPGTDQMLGFGFVTMGNIFEASLALRKMNGCEIKGRKVAVDWALDRKVYLSKKQQSETAVTEESVDSETHSDADDPAVPSDEVEPEAANGSVCSDSDSVDQQTHSVPLSNPESKVRPRRDDSIDGKCLFLRNLPFSFDEEELESYFTEEFGPIKYAKLVTNRETGMLTGNGFVRFIDKSIAEECLQQSEEGLVVEGRTVEVMRAVTKVEATSFSETRKRKKEDKRNLSMGHFGSIDPDSEEFQDLSKADKDKRMRAENEKLEKLKNPNIFVSRDRLSIRNLALSMGDQELKKLCVRHTPKGGRVKSARIMRDMDRLQDGVGRSKGFGFVEFSSHEAALSVLKSLNNNPEILPNKRRLIVEFSLENQRAVKAKELRLEKSRLKLEQLRDEKETSNSTSKQNEKTRNIGRNKFGKVLDKKIRTKPSRKLGRDKQNKNNPTKLPNKHKNIDQIHSRVTNTIDSQRQTPLPERTRPSRSKTTQSPSRRERKRKDGEREERDEKRFEELVRQYQKKLFRMNPT